MCKLSYIERLDNLGLELLELRRLRVDIINYFKLRNGLSPINLFNHFLIHHPIFSSRSSLPHLENLQDASLSSLIPFSILTWTFGSLLQSLLKLYPLCHCLNHPLTRLISPRFRRTMKFSASNFKC